MKHCQSFARLMPTNGRCSDLLNKLHPVTLSFRLHWYHFGATNEFGHPDDENKVGLSSGDLKASNASISFSLSDHS